MAENLNYEADSSKCYGDVNVVFDETKVLSPAEIQANCSKYGRLYSWETALKACPSGWHLPSNVEWDVLFHYVDGTSGMRTPYKSETAGKFLKATSGWNDYEGKSGNGKDKYGFSALPGGSGDLFHFNRVGEIGWWWSSSKNYEYDGLAYARYMSYDSEKVSSGGHKRDLFSVRCVKDVLCGSQTFNTSTQFCDNNTVYDLCEGQIYTPANQRCSAANRVETMCGTVWFDATNVNQRCENGILETKCGTEWYNDPMQYCFNGTTMKYYGKLTDARDNKTYKTVKIGAQTWLAENLNYEAKGSKCHGEGGLVYNEKTEKHDITLSNAEIQANCKKYGRLYNWKTALKACPSGWHLPTNEEWKILTEVVGGDSTAGKNLKATSGWNDYEPSEFNYFSGGTFYNSERTSGNGTDAYGFSAMPGYRSGIGFDTFERLGVAGDWWTSSEDEMNYRLNSDYVHCRIMYESSDSIIYRYCDKSLLHGVRCLQDTPAPPKGDAK